MFSVTNDRGFVPQSEQFEDREMIGTDIKAYKIIHNGEFAYNPARINVGSIAKYNGVEDCMISSLYVCFDVDRKRINSEWFFHLLKTSKMNFYYNLNGEGGVRIYLFYPNFARIKSSYPTKAEQQKIADLFNLLTKRIETLIRVIEDLQTLKKAINDYLQAHFEPEFYLSFADLGTEFSGLSGKNAQDFGSGDPYITYVGVYAKNFVTENDCGLVTVLPTENQNKVNNGDVLFTLSSETPDEVCYGSVYVGKALNVYLNSFCFGVHITNSNVYSPYLAYFINSTIFRKAVFPLAQGSTRFNLQKSDFLKKRFSFPSLERQIEIFSTLNTLENKLQIESELLDQYKQQKQYLLQQMFI